MTKWTLFNALVNGQCVTLKDGRGDTYKDVIINTIQLEDGSGSSFNLHICCNVKESDRLYTIIHIRTID